VYATFGHYIFHTDYACARDSFCTGDARARDAFCSDGIFARARAQDKDKKSGSDNKPLRETEILQNALVKFGSLLQVRVLKP
jgi:hypothetical protein